MGEKPVITRTDGVVRIALGSSVGSNEAGQLWTEFNRICGRRAPERIIIESEPCFTCDSAGRAFLSLVHKYACKNTAHLDISSFGATLDELTGECPDIPLDENRRAGFGDFAESIGKGVVRGASHMRAEVEYLGMVLASFATAIRHPKSLRYGDLFSIIETASVNSFGICSAIGFLFGLILSFESAISLKMVGAEVYVASLVSITLFRVLGPFIAALLFAARSSTAYAAEIGTMKINEEIDALYTMGLAPVPFLVLPRVIAGTLFLPFLTMYVNLFGIVGMGVVMRSMGFPIQVIHDQLTLLTTMTDFVSGLCKAIVYGFEVASIGCLRGLQTGSGSKAVGNAATRAVVTSIVVVVITEGIFSLIFYILGI
ncbi:MAG: MlaE family ABC transporter permease [Phycisphaerae bacterium]|jgi:phospholipid/cholesterol/gamma-HCH transport system permease protein